MISLDNTPPKESGVFVYVCPRCGKTLDIDRRYCDCHTDVRHPGLMRFSQEPPDIGPCNFETENLTCSDCPETCAWCASFGAVGLNNQGFGGKDCRYMHDTARCHCCQAQVKIAIALNTDQFWELIHSGLEISQKKPDKDGDTEPVNIYAKMAQYIGEESEKPVYARIRQWRQKIA